MNGDPNGCGNKMGKYGEELGSLGKFENARKTQTHSSELEHASSRVGLHAASALRIGEARSDAKGSRHHPL